MKFNVKLIILIILIIIAIILLIFYFLKPKKSNKKHIKKTRLPKESTNDINKVVTLSDNINIKSVTKNNITFNLYDTTNNYFPENDTNIVTNLPSNLNFTGVALSGGGTRASAASLGILRVLNQNNFLSRDKIQFITSNSGSTWSLLPSFYQNINSTSSDPSLTDILGTYIDPTPSQNNYFDTSNISDNNLISVLSNNIFNLDLTPEWWTKSVGLSFFQKYNLYSTNNSIINNTIVGLNKTPVQNLVNLFNSEYSNGKNIYQGVILRDNLPIPIALQSCSIVDVTVSDQTSWIPFDSSPISSGFLGTNSTFCGRIDSYAFNFDFDNKNLQNTWDPVVMSGISSMASGPGMVRYNHMFSLIQSFNFNNFQLSTLSCNKIPSPKLSLLDGYLVDDCAIVPLLYRNIKKIVCIDNLAPHDLFYSYNNPNDPGPILHQIIYITSPIEQQYKVGIITNIDITSDTSNIIYTIFIIDYNYLYSNKRTNIQIKIPKTDNKVIAKYFRLIQFNDINKLFINNYLSNDNIDYITIDTNNPCPQLTASDNIKDYINKFIQEYYCNYKQDLSIKNTFDMTKFNLIFNFILTGYLYFNHTYINNITKEEVEILWYILSPNPNFYNLLSSTDQQKIDNIYMFPNICTFFPFRSDCNNDNCNTYCINKDDQKTLLLDSIANDKTLQSISKLEALSISSLTSFVCKNLVLPFLNKKDSSILQLPIGDYKYNRNTPINYDSFINKAFPKICDQEDCEDELYIAIQKFIDTLNSKFSKLSDNINVNLQQIICNSPYFLALTINKVTNLNTLQFSIPSKKLKGYSPLKYYSKDGKNYVSLTLNINTGGVTLNISNNTISSYSYDIPLYNLQGAFELEVSKNINDGTMNIRNFYISNLSPGPDIFYKIFEYSGLLFLTFFNSAGYYLLQIMIIITIFVKMIYAYITGKWTSGRNFTVEGVDIEVGIDVDTLNTPLLQEGLATANTIEVAEPTSRWKNFINTISSGLKSMWPYVKNFIIKYSFYFLLFWIIILPLLLLIILGMVIPLIFKFSNINLMEEKKCGPTYNTYTKQVDNISCDHGNEEICQLTDPSCQDQPANNIYCERTCVCSPDFPECHSLKTPFICNKCTYNTPVVSHKLNLNYNKIGVKNIQFSKDIVNNSNLCGGVNIKFLRTVEPNLIWKLQKIDISNSNITVAKYKIDPNTTNSDIKVLINQDDNNIKISYQNYQNNESYLIKIISTNDSSVGTNEEFLLDTENNIYINITNFMSMFIPINCTQNGLEICSTLTDENNCGECGKICQSDCEKCCASQGCVNYLTDRNNCGDCGISCPERKACVQGRCRYSKNYTCNGHGKVNMQTGICTCDSNWSGQNCDQEITPIQPPPTVACQSSNLNNQIQLYDESTRQTVYYGSIYTDNNCGNPKILSQFMQNNWKLYEELSIADYINKFDYGSIVVGLLGNLSCGFITPDSSGNFALGQYDNNNFKVKLISNKLLILRHHIMKIYDPISNQWIEEYKPIPDTNLYIYDYNKTLPGEKPTLLNTALSKLTLNFRSF